MPTIVQEMQGGKPQLKYCYGTTVGHRNAAYFKTMTYDRYIPEKAEI